MLKHKLKAVEKELKQLSRGKKTGIFFVGIEKGIYTIKTAGKLAYQGDKAGYDSFVQKYDEGSVFIIDDIPREKSGTNLLDWVD